MQTDNANIIDSNDPRAILRAWINDADMGGWPNDDADAFRAAVVAEAARAFGISESEVETVEIEEVDN